MTTQDTPDDEPDVLIIDSASLLAALELTVDSTNTEIDMAIMCLIPDCFCEHDVTIGPLGIEINAQCLAQDQLDFPFLRSDLFNMVELLDLEGETASRYSSLASEIAELEGLDELGLRILVDDGYDGPLGSLAPERIALRRVGWVQPVYEEYPFTEPADGAMTWAEWLDERFLPNFAGLAIVDESHESLHPSVTLDSLRKGNSEPRPAIRVRP